MCEICLWQTGVEDGPVTGCETCAYQAESDYDCGDYLEWPDHECWAPEVLRDCP